MADEKETPREDIEVDVPEADALEQKAPVADDGEDDDELRSVRIPPDVPEADALDQARGAGLEDDDHA